MAYKEPHFDNPAAAKAFAEALGKANADMVRKPKSGGKSPSAGRRKPSPGKKQGK